VTTPLHDWQPVTNNVGWLVLGLTLMIVHYRTVMWLGKETELNDHGQYTRSDRSFYRIMALCPLVGISAATMMWVESRPHRPDEVLETRKRPGG
jgi:hypothetical protein